MMIVLILLQSLSAMAKSVDFHVLDAEHIKSEHVHAVDDHVTAEHISQPTGDSDNHNSADCHHCGHCSGTHMQYVSITYISEHLDFISNHIFDYLKVIIEAPISRLLRPPKS